jgi:hypothetical protein
VHEQKGFRVFGQSHQCIWRESVWILGRAGDLPILNAAQFVQSDIAPAALMSTVKRANFGKQLARVEPDRARVAVGIH